MVSKQRRTSKKAIFFNIAIGAVIALSLGLSFISTPSFAAANTVAVGQETGLPIPRFVSLKSRSVNLRVGPGRKYAIQWQYTMRGLPVEVIQEFEQWRRIRDSEGSTGWVLHSLLSSKRTAIVAPWDTPKIEIGNVVKASFHDGKGSAHQDASTVARLQPGLMVNVNECSGSWCEAEARGTHFWINQNSLWGVYPGESIDD